MAATIRQAIHLIGRQNLSRWLALVLIAIVASGFELVGAVLVFLLLTLVVDPTDDIELPIIGNVRELAGNVDDQALLLWIVIGMAVFFGARALVHIGKTYAQNRIAHNFGARLSGRLAGGYLSMPYSAHLRRNSSELIRNSYHSVSQLVVQVFLPLINIMAESLLVLAMLALLMIVAPIATLLAVFVIGTAATILLTLVQPRLKRLGRSVHKTEEETLGILQQSLHGIRDVKVLAKERVFARRYQRGRLRVARGRYLYSTASILPRDVMETALMGFILGFFSFAILTGQGQATLSVLGMFAYAGFRLQPSLQKIVAGLNNLKFASAPLDDLHRDLQMIEALPREATDLQSLEFKDEWRAKNLVFQYEGATTPALQGIDLAIRPGQVVGVCGPTGGGKTTLVDVLCGLLEPTQGAVTVDGKDLRGHARAWHKRLGIVPQMVFLIDDSLRANIALGVSAEEVDETALREAVHLAQLDDFVDSLPDGLDTKVGERGVRVSGGQRQRVAIARALYRRPEVLVFDEGTSALDNRTEAVLMRALERLRGDHTILLVAHRLTTVQNCDQVAFIEDGHIAGLGTFAELTGSNERFRRLAATDP